MFDADQALETIRRLDFPRVCGSEGEARAMALLADELRALGFEAECQSFEDWWVEPEDACLIAGDQAVPVEPAMSLAFLGGFEWMEGRGPEVEVSGELARSGEGCLLVREVCDFSAALLPGASGQILLFEPVPEFEAYLWAQEFVPSAYASRENARRVLDMLGEASTLRWKSRPCRREFRNLVLGIPGRVSTQESVVMGAHIDSFPGTVGSSDDAAGCAILLEAARHFATHQPDRTISLVWFTGEELDRRGSRQFVEHYGVEPSTTKLCLNIDGGYEQGTGDPWIQISEEKTAAWADECLGDCGMQIRIGTIKGSDGETFGDRGIPVLGVHGRSRQCQHLPTDRPERIDKSKLKLMGSVAVQVASLASQAGFEYNRLEGG